MEVRRDGWPASASFAGVGLILCLGGEVNAVAALPLLDGRHVTEPPDPALRAAGFDDGRQPARHRRAGPALVHAHNSHLQRDKSTMRMGGQRLEWWSAGAIVSAQLGEGYAFLATALGTIRHHGVDTPPPDTIEGLLYALPEDRYVVDARRLAEILRDATPAARVSPWFGYAPMDPAHVASTDGIVFVKDASGSRRGCRW
jgi:hypothetical protein